MLLMVNCPEPLTGLQKPRLFVAVDPVVTATLGKVGVMKVVVMGMTCYLACFLSRT